MMEEWMYQMIFKRKSFHRFQDAGVIRAEELAGIEEAFETFTPLRSDIKIEHRIVPAEATTCRRGQEYCILLYSEEKEGFLQNIGYIGAQLDLYLACRNIGALWFGIGKTEVPSSTGLPFVIMIAIAQVGEDRFRRDMFKSKRKPLSEIWTGEDWSEVGNIVRFAPSACNTQPWIVERSGEKLEVYRYKKPGKRGIMPAERVAYYNRIDMGIFLLFLELCMNHGQTSFQRTLYEDTGDEEKTLTAVYCLERTKNDH